MRDKPVKMQNFYARRLAQLEESLKRKGGLGHTAVVEDVVTVQGKYKSVRLGNLGMRKRNYTKHVVAECEIVWE
jgi:hypothetical protein